MRVRGGEVWSKGKQQQISRTNRFNVTFVPHHTHTKVHLYCPWKSTRFWWLGSVFLFHVSTCNSSRSSVLRPLISPGHGAITNYAACIAATNSSSWRTVILLCWWSSNTHKLKSRVCILTEGIRAEDAHKQTVLLLLSRLFCNNHVTHCTLIALRLSRRKHRSIQIRQFPLRTAQVAADHNHTRSALQGRHREGIQKTFLLRKFNQRKTPDILASFGMEEVDVATCVMGAWLSLTSPNQTKLSTRFHIAMQSRSPRWCSS